MAKKDPSDFMLNIVTGGKNTERTRKEKAPPVPRRTQKAPKKHTEETRFQDYSETELGTFSVRLMEKDKRVLKEYFARRSLSLSQGIRQVLIDFMEKQGL